MKFKLACADFTFPLLPHGPVLELISFLDIEGVDIGLFEGRSHLWPSKEFKDLEGAASRLKNNSMTSGSNPPTCSCRWPRTSHRMRSIIPMKPGASMRVTGSSRP